jgi:hypothetical protein
MSFWRITTWLACNELLILPRTLEFSVNSGKHSTRTLSLVQNRVSFLKKKQPAKKSTLAFEGGLKLRNAPFLVLNWASSSFDPLFPERLHCSYIHFHCTYLYNYYNYLEPCALNAEFQQFIPRFNKTSSLCGPHSKRG